MTENKQEPHRERLPNTRESVTHKFYIDGHKGYITVGFYPDGRPGEVFIQMAKEGSTIGGLMDTVGILTSLALQYGVSVKTLARKFESTRFDPRGKTHEPLIGDVSSISDYLFRWLEKCNIQLDPETLQAEQRPPEYHRSAQVSSFTEKHKGDE